ncbi:Gfo/Idh/MocA family oxidoreductase [Escherichia coli]
MPYSCILQHGFSHFEVVSRLLNAGVHVCVDKPLADKLSDAEALVELAARRHLTLIVGLTAVLPPSIAS